MTLTAATTAAALTPAEVNIRILIAVAAVLVAARLGGWLVSKVGQPQVHGEILSGIILGPSLLGLLWPGANDFLFPTEIVGALKILAQLGLVLFMFLIGVELDLPQLRGQGHKAILISHASILLPFVLGAALGWWLHPRFGGDTDQLGFVLFLGAAMAITAFPVLARVLQETGLYRTRVGVLTMTCAAVDDLTAWCVLAVVVAVVKSSGFTDALTTIALALTFVAVMLGLVKPLLARLPAVPVWVVLALALSCAWITEEIGVHAIFGAFLAGTVVPRAGGLTAEIKEKLETATLVLLLPVFFVVVGLATRIDLLDRADLWGVTLVVIAAAIVGKWGGSAIAARITGEAWRDANVIGILMNTRGLTELVILSVGLELGVIGPTIFTIMVLMALVTTLMATPLLALVVPDYRHRQLAEEPSADDAAAAPSSVPSSVTGSPSAGMAGASVPSPAGVVDGTARPDGD